MGLLLTGSTGFIGQALEAEASQRGLAPRCALRRPAADKTGQRGVVVGDIGPDTDWQAALVGRSVVVHLAALAHWGPINGPQALAELQRVNVQGSLNLARQAAATGVRRLVYLSSIKVNGEQTGERPFRADDPPRPEDAYGRSKWQAEQGLRALAAQTGLELVIIRPPLVHGPGVKGNLARLLGWLQGGWPLPLASLDNRRSLLGLDNLVDLILCCAEHPQAAGQCLLASDGEDVSTPELIRRLGRIMQRPTRLLPLPAAVLEQAAALLGKGEMLRRLTGSLQVDMGPTQQRLGWTPPLSLEQGLCRMLGVGDG
ncbi:MAG: NAD-dependent epimerase/dehydratase family protein [Gammaproteobacteria bacterium SHHR-1]